MHSIVDHRIPVANTVHGAAAYAASHSSIHSDTASRDTDTDTDDVLSYYRSTRDAASSNVATTPRAGAQSRHNSNTSTSTSTYSSDYSVASAADNLSTSTDIHTIQPCVEPPSAVSARRRPSIPTQGGNDRRRLAIVEHDANDQDSSHRQTSDSVGSRHRATHSSSGLALVAPPDASPRSYSALPSYRASLPQDGQSVPSSRSHTRSSSEAVRASNKAMGHVPRKSSREVAIVGTAAGFPEGTASDLQQWSKFSPHLDALKPPLFQMPQSRSPSPGTSEVSDCSSSAYRARQRKDAITLGVSPIKELKEGSTPVVTPNIGDSKHISDRVAGPIIINLFPESPSPSPRSTSQRSTSQQSTASSVIFSDPFSPSTAPTSPASDMLPYLHYQPGIHATAGPLPPPPMALYNIDPTAPPPPRPPRQYPIRRRGDMEAIKEALQLPRHVSAALKAKSSSAASSPKSEATESYGSPLSSVKELPSYKNVEAASMAESTDSLPKPIHTREGAFPPSRLCTLDGGDAATRVDSVTLPVSQSDSMDDLMATIGLAIDDMGIINSDDVPPPTIVEPPRNHEGHNGRQGLELRGKEQARYSVGTEASRADHSPSQSEENTSRSSPLDKVLPPVPAAGDDLNVDVKIKSMIQKRFSTLPRTPSLISLNRHSATSKQSTGSPPLSVDRPILLARPPVRRIKSASPSAMYFSDVLVKKTALERSIGYARKINELYHYDCGLSGWMAEVRCRATRPQSTGKRTVLNSERPLAPSTFAPPVERRHVSQSSTDSGVTFPRRPDAYSATDLSSRVAGDGSPPNAPPPLPYPALAAAPRNGPSRASTIIVTSSSSSSSTKSPGGFFSALGRKTSLKKEHSLNTPSSPVRTLLTKSPPKVEPTPRPVNVAPVTPSIPGGPRAPPNRVQRSQTIILTPQPPPNNTIPQRSSTTGRRPSLFGGRGSNSNPEKQSNATSEIDFNRQLDRLAALLPRANKSLLATYLRHTGQDMLALGQYIEDDKNGTYRYDSA